jgi:hypothetical protein
MRGPHRQPSRHYPSSHTTLKAGAIAFPVVARIPAAGRRNAGFAVRP